MKTPLSYLTNQYPLDLSDCLVIASQHLLKSNLMLFDELLNRGLKKQDLYIIGKVYSTHKPTYQVLLKKGFNVHKSSVKFDSYLSFDEQFSRHIKDFLKPIFKKDLKGFRKVILIDDGGYLLVHAQHLIKDPSNIIGVEQTSSGYSYIKGIVKFPVVNVARSKAKLEKESLLIARLIVSKSKVHLKKLGHKGSVLIIGQGSVGSNVASLLKKEYKIFKYDKVSQGELFPGKFKKDLPKYDIIFGCTGSSVVSPQDFGELKKGTVLVSGSSSDREFSSVYLRKFLTKYNNPHRDIKSKGLLLINSGFPVNFTGEAYSLAPKDVLLTRSLVMAGIIQASETNKKGMIELDGSMQKFILKQTNIN